MVKNEFNFYRKKTKCKNNFFFCFQILENLCGGRFHNHLRDTFAPQVIRYVDLMENTVGQALLKGYEKEKWDLKGYVLFACFVRVCNEYFYLFLAFFQ